MLGRTVAEKLACTPAAEVWPPGVREVCADCDVLVVNLECCVSGEGSPTAVIPGKQFFFRAPPAAMVSLRAIGASVAGMANNHALDFGGDALADTLGHLRAAGIVPVGAGIDIEGARRGVVVRAGGSRLGVLALSDHPREYAAGEGRAGIAYADLRRGLPEWVTSELRRLRAHAELVLVFPHWGPNMTSRPLSSQHERGHQLLAAGADAVAGHSAHVFHGGALTPTGPVLYDRGGALDDYAIDGKLRKRRRSARPVAAPRRARGPADWPPPRFLSDRASGRRGRRVDRRPTGASLRGAGRLRRAGGRGALRATGAGPRPLTRSGRQTSCRRLRRRHLGTEKCAQGDSNSHGPNGPQGPQPCASTSSATGA
jgi:Bacterial capsule synthesis protein PGA_cap